MRYSTTLTLSQQLLVGTLQGGQVPKLRKHDFFDVLEAIGYVLRTGCQWKMLPHGFPHWNTVYHHFSDIPAR